VERFKPLHFFPFGQSTRREGFDIDSERDLATDSAVTVERSRRAIIIRFDLVGLFMKETRKQEESIVQPLESSFAFGNSAFAKNNGLLSSHQRLSYQLPLFEGDGTPLRIDLLHLP